MAVLKVSNIMTAFMMELSVYFFFIVFVYIFEGSDPVSPCSPSSPNPAMTTTESSITSPIDLAKALANLQSTSVGCCFLYY